MKDFRYSIKKLEWNCFHIYSNISSCAVFLLFTCHPLVPASCHPLVPASCHPLVPASCHPLVPASCHPLVPASFHLLVPASSSSVLSFLETPIFHKSVYLQSDFQLRLDRVILLSLCPVLFLLLLAHRELDLRAM